MPAHLSQVSGSDVTSLDCCACRPPSPKACRPPARTATATCTPHTLSSSLSFWTARLAWACSAPTAPQQPQSQRQSSQEPSHGMLTHTTRSTSFTTPHSFSSALTSHTTLTNALGCRPSTLPSWCGSGIGHHMLPDQGCSSCLHNSSHCAASCCARAAVLLIDCLSLRYVLCRAVQRDVPGLTRASIPVFVSRGIKAISVGVNAGSAPPGVPWFTPFIWRDEASGTQILAFWHPGAGVGSRAQRTHGAADRLGKGWMPLTHHQLLPLHRRLQLAPFVRLCKALSQAVQVCFCS